MIYIVLSIFMALLGFAGAIIPALPGPPFSWLALLLLSFYPATDFSNVLLIVMAVIAIALTVLDYIIPSLATKKFGGSKAGVWGCNVGLFISFIGLPLGPQGILGVILWPFIGAFVGELIKSKDFKVSLRSALGAFTGFLCGTGLKLIYAVTVIFTIILELIF